MLLAIRSDDIFKYATRVEEVRLCVVAHDIFLNLFRTCVFFYENLFDIGVLVRSVVFQSKFKCTIMFMIT